MNLTMIFNFIEEQILLNAFGTYFSCVYIHENLSYVKSPSQLAVTIFVVLNTHIGCLCSAFVFSRTGLKLQKISLFSYREGIMLLR
jgi:hypothetical protein